MNIDVNTIDLTPSPAATKQMLQMIIESSTSASDVNWAKSEMLRCFPPATMQETNDMVYSEYVPKHERPVLTALIKALLQGAHTISVFDTEYYVLKRSTSLNAIRGALGGSGEDQLLIRDSAGEQLGWFYLIYNNGSNDDPMVVIADYSGNAYCDNIWDALRTKYDV